MSDRDKIWNKEKTLYFKKEKNWYRVYSAVLNRRGGLVKDYKDICPNSFIGVGVRLYLGSKLKNSKISGDIAIDNGSTITDCLIDTRKDKSSIISSSKLSNVSISLTNEICIEKSELEGNILIHDFGNMHLDNERDSCIIEIKNSKLSGDISVDAIVLSITDSNLSGDLIIHQRIENIKGCVVVGSVVLEPDEDDNLIDKICLEKVV